MDDIEITKLIDHPESLDELVPLLYDEFKRYIPDKVIDDVRSAIKQRMNRYSLPLGFVAHVKGELAGTVCLKEVELAYLTDKTPWLASLYLKPEYRGKGLGRFLERRIVEFAAFMGYPHLWLYTDSHQGYYQKLGWENELTENHHGLDIVIMKKILKTPEDGII